MSDVYLFRDQLQTLIQRALEGSNVSQENALSVAAALTQAQIDGQVGHGISRVASYCAQARSGKVNGHATPHIAAETASALRIDAQHGFAFPAIDLAIKELPNKAKSIGIAAATIFRSHHFGVAGWHVERLAMQDTVGIIVGNSPAAIAPFGGSTPIFGTNPIAFAAPRHSNDPLVIDLSLSQVARGKVMVAAKEGQSIPEGWGLDQNGQPTTDPKAVLQGSMLPMGGAKGAALVLLVEILSAALCGAQFGFEASSFFDAEGEPPAVGQTLLCIDPQLFSDDSFGNRLEVLLEQILMQEGARLPGTKRLTLREHSAIEGIAVSQVSLQEVEQLVR
jgi:(2R)-3-sulfolactate dehydrogenase (NADP+)